MTLLLIIAGLAVAAGVSQWWDERERAKSRAQVNAALQETESLCRAQAEAQSDYIPQHEPDKRDVARLAGKPNTPRNAQRNRAA